MKPELQNLEAAFREYEATIAAIDAARRPPPQIGEAKDWCLTSTEPGSEWRAADALIVRGFDVFAPTVTFRVRRDGRSFSRRQHLFPSYLFVAQPQGDCRFAEIEDCDGVAGVVRFDKRVTILPSLLVEKLAADVDGDCFRFDENLGHFRYVERGTPLEVLAKYRVGEPAKLDDPSLGFWPNAEIASPPTHYAVRDASGEEKRIECIWLLLGIFGQKTRVRASLASVEPLT
jgi:hypothetical protein